MITSNTALKTIRSKVSIDAEFNIGIKYKHWYPIFNSVCKENSILCLLNKSFLEIENLKWN